MASLLAIPAIDRFGRRALMFFGAIGMSAAMAILAGMVSTGTLDEETGAPVLEDSYGITAVVMLFVFNSFFGIGYVLPLPTGKLRPKLPSHDSSPESRISSCTTLVMKHF